MADYLAETILGAMVTQLKTITTANGYKVDVGSDSVFRLPQPPEEAEIDIDVLPALWVIDGTVELVDMKSRNKWIIKPTIRGLISSTTTTPSTAYNNLLWDTIKLVLTKRTSWSTAAYETLFTRIGRIPELTKPHAGFDIELAIWFESTATDPSAA